jgi:uncharacterized protein (DUF1330 family)
VTAFVIVEFNVRDAIALRQYVQEAGPVIAGHGGEVVGRGSLRGMEGEGSFFEGAVLIAFPSAEAAQAWYRSPAYTALCGQRELAMSAQFKLLG